ncbi:hypothetical protein [Thalassospira xiamenensis]|uniref:Uncharacterized protein n=1 Tax=Thalassospira xiamenensis TaxID=220697 RepID=A0A285TRP1_9PROT|nr:hypothetical protein [Thalassospira xiamenensis]SOC26120.1 hypothetical protein SAMN05428964_10554 [Thalassospira xiamenensis]
MSNFSIRARPLDGGYTGITIRSGVDASVFSLDKEALRDLARVVNDAVRADAERDIAQNLPDRNFLAELVTNRLEHRTNCGRLFKPDGIDDVVLNSTPLAELSWANLFAYMHRRFGPPHVPTDNYKDLCGGWFLSSPEPDLIVSVVPYAGHVCALSFQPLFSGSYEKLRENGGEAVPELKDRLGAAYRTVLLDLLRPVVVRDYHINSLGKVEDSSPLLAWETRDDEEEACFTVEQHPSAGIAIPPGLLESRGWGNFIPFITAIGDGDVEAGCETVLKQAIQSVAPQEIARASWPVLRTMLLAVNQTEYPELIKLMGLSDVQREIIATEQDKLGIGTPNAPDASLMAEFTDETIRDAKRLAAILGHPRLQIWSFVKNLKSKHNLISASQDFYAVFPDGIPIDLLPTLQEVPLHFGDRLQFLNTIRELDQGKLTEWVSANIEKPYGVGMMLHIIYMERARLERVAQDRQEEPALQQP